MSSRVLPLLAAFLAGALLTLAIVLISGLGQSHTEQAALQRAELWVVVSDDQAPVPPIGDEVVLSDGSEAGPYFYLSPDQAEAVQGGAEPLNASLRVSAISGGSLETIAAQIGAHEGRGSGALGRAFVSPDGLRAIVELKSEKSGLLDLESPSAQRIDEALSGAGQ